MAHNRGFAAKHLRRTYRRTNDIFAAEMYIFARWILGFGIPFCIIGGSSLMGELAYPKERALMTSLFNALWFVGSLIAAGVSFGTQVSTLFNITLIDTS